MTIQEMITEVINDYVSSNGTSSIMDKDQLYAMVSEVYQINKNSFLPADFCYNRTNEGIDFEKRIASIYQKCKTSDEITQEFDESQEEMAEAINEKMTQARQTIL